MTTTDPAASDRPPLGDAPAITTDPGGPPPLAPLVGRRPVTGAGSAAKNVIADVQALVKAEVALAKAELTSGLKSKAKGAGLFIGVAVVGWLALQVFLVFLGFLFALFLPGWAAVGLVLLLLLLVMGVLGYLGYRKMQAEANLQTTMQTVRESQQATAQAVSQAQDNTRAGVEQAKSTITMAGRDLAEDVRRRVEGPQPRDTGATPVRPPAGTVSPPHAASSAQPSPLSIPPGNGPDHV